MCTRVTQGYAGAHARKRAVSVAAWSLEPFVQIPLFFCIIGAWQGLALAFYLTAIVALLFQVIVLFTDLVTSMIARDRM